MNEVSSLPTSSEPEYANHSGHKIELLLAARRVRIEFGGETMADSIDAQLMRENTCPLVYYIPREDVRMALLEETGQSTYCPFKGEA
jgi:uncharacterized protein (DUF427 family)